MIAIVVVWIVAAVVLGWIGYIAWVEPAHTSS
jgi:hypothetical protein